MNDDTFAADMEAQDTDAAWHQAIAEREERLEEALRRMLSHTSTQEDHNLIVAYCGMSHIVERK